MITRMMKHPCLQRFAARKAVAFQILDPQVQLVKASPTVQIATGATVAGLALTGHLLPAVALSAAWLGARPLTHVAAGTVAGVGVCDDLVLAAFQRLHALKLCEDVGQPEATTELNAEMTPG